MDDYYIDGVVSAAELCPVEFDCPLCGSELGIVRDGTVWCDTCQEEMDTEIFIKEGFVFVISGIYPKIRGSRCDIKT